MNTKLLIPHVFTIFTFRKSKFPPHQLAGKRFALHQEKKKILTLPLKLKIMVHKVAKIVQITFSFANLFQCSSVADPVPFWPLDPGWMKNQDPDPGWTSRIIFPRAKKLFFGLKILILLFRHGSGIRDPESFWPWNRDPRWKFWIWANLPQVSLTSAANFATSTAGVVDTGGKFVTGVNNTCGK